MNTLYPEDEIINPHYEVKAEQEEKRSLFRPFDILRGEKEVLRYEDKYVAPFTLEDHSLELTNEENKRALKGLVLVHKLDRYRKMDTRFLLIPKVTTLLDLVLQGGTSDAVILSPKGST